MALRERLLHVLNSKRAFIESKGLRTSSLTIVTRTWTGEPGATGSTYVDAPSLTISPRPKVREAKPGANMAPELAESAGRLRAGDYLVTKITPYDAGPPSPVGYTVAQLRPVPTAYGVEVIYLLTLPEGLAECELISLGQTKNFGYEMVLRRRASSP